MWGNYYIGKTATSAVKSRFHSHPKVKKIIISRFINTLFFESVIIREDIAINEERYLPCKKKNGRYQVLY